MLLLKKKQTIIFNETIIIFNFMLSNKKKLLKFIKQLNWWKLTYGG